MTLPEVIDALDRFDPAQVIYASDTHPDAQAIVDYESDDGDPPASAAGMRLSPGNIPRPRRPPRLVQLTRRSSADP